METVYIALVRWGGGWDNQTLYYTDNKALFDQIESSNDMEVFFPQFNDELKANLRTTIEAFSKAHTDVTLDTEEDMNITEAMEWLQIVSPTFPVIVAGETELTCSWNW